MSELEKFSPFDCGFGRHVNCMEIGLGEDRGFMKIWAHGELQIWGNEDDPLGPPGITFNPSNAELLRALADELESRAGEYAEYQREQAGESQQPEPAGAAPTKKPVIVAGAGASDSLNSFCLK